MRTTLAFLLATFCCSIAGRGQGVIALTINNTTNTSRTLTITNGQVATLKSTYYDWEGRNGGGYTELAVRIGEVEMRQPITLFKVLPLLTIPGPASLTLTNLDGAPYLENAMATFDIQPGPTPPDKTATIGSNAGDIQVTMEMSTDLVNWAPAVNAAVYTNSPSPRFFRIRMAAGK